MRLYEGKLNIRTQPWGSKEFISFSFNGGFRQGSTAYMVSQWSQDNSGPKPIYCFEGTITKLDENKIEIFFDEESSFLWFNGEIRQDRLFLAMTRQGHYTLGEAMLTLAFNDED
ncbi:hypothetical protein BDV24DRAFT_163076 [Aspergillus arachidicola]|uniref:Uncharacterized protein n=1 Tax=Aspergillus arachidicola TaxID=656916 RepID=A0A5N6Y8Q2_9EURO|nr:hypothetical protein BDV24DRAFT_163076 [Aspergillus arachidicola]